MGLSCSLGEVQPQGSCPGDNDWQPRSRRGLRDGAPVSTGLPAPVEWLACVGRPTEDSVTCASTLGVC